MAHRNRTFRLVLAAPLLLLCALVTLADSAFAKPRYFVMEIFSWDPIGDAYDAEFKSYVDACAAKGFNVIRMDIPWDTTEPAIGVYNWTKIDRQLDYIVSRGLKLMLIVNTRNKALWLIDAKTPTDGYDSYLMRRADGSVHKGANGYTLGGVPITSFGTLTLNSGWVLSKIASFHQAVVQRYQQRYPRGTVLNFMSCFTPTLEAEYDHIDYLDFGSFAKLEYRQWLQQRYGNILALNSKWRTAYVSFAQIDPYVNAGAPKPDYDVRYMDWQRFRTFSLRRFFDTMADTVHAAAPGAEYGMQFGGAMWHEPWKRGIYAEQSMTAKADWVTVDGQQAFPAAFNADVNRASLRGKKLMAELDGPHRGYTDQQNLTAGKAFFDRGYDAVDLANWSFRGLTELNDPKWTFLPQLASMARAQVPTITPASTITISVTDLYAFHDTYTFENQVISRWLQASSNGQKIIDVIYQDDLR
ncbi:MAG: beta-galactosidase [Planctomycetota bacterium]